MNKAYLIILGGGDAQFQFIQSGKKLGYKIIIIDRNPHAVGVPLSDIYIKASTHNVNFIIKKLKNLNVNIVGLIARTNGKPLFTAAKLNESFNLIGINYELAKISTSKSELRKFLNKIDVPCPEGQNINSMDKELAKHLHQKYNKVVTKPEITIVGKKDIYLCRSVNEIKARAYKSILSSYNKKAEVQRFIDGKDTCFLVLFYKGKFKTLLSWDEVNSFNGPLKKLVGKYISMPARKLSKKSKKLIFQCCNKFAKHFSKSSFLLAFSFRFDKKGNGYLIEVHGDLTGDSILDELAPKSTNTNFFDKIINFHVKKHFSTTYKMKNTIIKHP